MVKSAGMTLILQMMTGLPGSDAQSDLRTGERLAELKPNGVRIYPTVILRGTVLERMWREGKYAAHTVHDAVNTCAPIADVFLRAGIPILRLGLNQTEALAGGEAVGGACHPALGELVYARLYRNEAERQLEAFGPLPPSVTLLVHPGGLSRLTGRGRENLLWLRDRFGLRELRAEEGDLPPGSLAIRGETE